MFSFFYTHSSTRLLLTVVIGVVGIVFSVGAHSVQAADTLNIQRPKNHVIGVHLSDVSGTMVFTANGPFVVETDARELLKDFTAGEQVSIRTEGAEYILNYGPSFSKEVRSAKPLQVTTVKRSDLIEIVNFVNPSSWEETDNLFYHTVRFVKDSRGVPVLVNDVGIERYTEGLCESGNVDKTEYIKALMTAARTYALYHTLNNSKYPNEPYDIDSTAKSQIFCGAEFTQRTPQVRAARKATRKHVVFYQGEIVLTPYFSVSDGRTRAWGEVWSGDKGYLQSVDDPCCHGRALWGHGVGLSGEGSRYFADRGWTWKQILQYYYQGTEIKRY